MKTKDFLKQHNAGIDGAKWALSIGGDMADVWDAMIEHGKHEWLVWAATRPEVFPDAVLHKLACRFVRETPLSDGRKVWDLLTDERSRKAVEVAELSADGKATQQELAAADAAAFAALAAARDVARADAVRASAYATNAAHAAAFAAFAARDAASAAATCVAAYDAAYAAAYAAAYVAAAARDAAGRDAGRAALAADASAYACDAAEEAASDAAQAAQAQMIVEMGNPFKERTGR